MKFLKKEQHTIRLVSCIEWLWDLLLRIIENTIYLTVTVCCVCAWFGQKGSEKKDILKKAGVNGVIFKISK